MSSERYQLKLVTKLLIALVMWILIIIYNRFYYDAIIVVRERLQLFELKQKNVTLKDSKEIQIAKTPPKGYLVWSYNCHMLSMDPFDPIYMSDYKPQQAPNCSDKPPLIVKLFNVSTKKYFLYMDMHVKSAYVKYDTEPLECCYQKILRKGEKNTKYVSLKN